MKKGIYLVVIFLYLFCSFTWAQTDDIAKLLGGVAGDAASQGIVTDSDGSVYMKGSFSGSLKIGSAYYRNNGRDDFLCKNDQNGNLQWFKQIGFDGASESQSNLNAIGDIAIDASKNTYVIGSFSGDANIESNILTNNGNKDIYVAKYDPNGALVWIRNFGGADDEFGYTIDVDNSQNVYVGGSTSSASIVFNSTTETKPGSAGIRAAFIAKYDNAGNEDWFEFIGSASTPDQDAAYELVVNSIDQLLFVTGELDEKPFYGNYSLTDGSQTWITISTGTSKGAGHGIDFHSINQVIFITGWFDGPDLGFGGPLLSHNALKDIFVIKVNPANGFPISQETFGGSSDEEGKDITIDETNNETFITGYYSSNDLNISGSSLPAPSIMDPLIFSVDDVAAGVKSIGISTSRKAEGTAITVYPTTGKLYTGGFIDGISDFGTLQINNSLPSFYISSYNTTDLANNWTAASPKGQIIAQELVVSSADEVIVAGQFVGTVDVSGQRIISTENNSSLHDLFVAKFRANGDLDWITTAASSALDEVYSLTVAGNGDISFGAFFTNAPTISGTVLTPFESGEVVVTLDVDGVYKDIFRIDPDGTVVDIQADPSGTDLYMVGYYSGDFSITEGTISSDNGSVDIFLIRKASGFNLIQGLSIGVNDGDDYPTDITMLPGGELYVTGESKAFQLVVGACPACNYTAGEPENIFFVASYDNTLNATNAFFKGQLPNALKSGTIGLDPSRNIYITGYYENDLQVGTVTFATAPQSFFLLKLSNTWNPVWGESIIRTVEDGGGSIDDIVVDSDANIYLSGKMELGPSGEDGDLDFAGNVISHSGSEDAFLAKYDTDGNYEFASAYGSDYDNTVEGFVGEEYGFGLDVNSSDEVWYTGSLSVRSEDFGNNTLEPYGSSFLGVNTGWDSYLIKFTSALASPSSQKMYWTNPPTQINRANLDGSNSENFYTGGGNQQGVAIDYNNDVIYWTDKNNNDIWMADLADPNNTNVLLFQSSDGISEPMGIAVDSDVNNRIYWTEKGTNNRIASADLDGGNPNFNYITGLSSPHDIVVVPGQDQLYYSDLNRLRRADLSTGSNLQTVYDFGTGQILGIDVDVANNTIYWVGDGVTEMASLAQPLPISVSDNSIGNGGFTDFDGHDIEVDPDGGFAYYISTDDMLLITYPLDLSIAAVSTDLDGSINALFNDPQFLELDLRTGPSPIIEVFPSGSLTRCIADPPTTITATAGDSYQWFNGAILITGATNQTYTTTTSGDFNVEVTIGGVPYMSTNSLDILAESNPEITSDPLDTSNCPGGGVTFTVVPDALSPGFTWYESTDGGTTFSSISDGGVYSGATTATLNISDVTGLDGNIYKVEVFELSTSLNCSIESGTALLTASGSIADAGSDIAVCDTSPVQLNGSVGGGATGGTWTSSGDGTFDNASSLSASYTPGISDISTGSVLLTLTTTGSCTPTSDDVTLTFGSPPTADAGSDILICEGNTAQLNGSIGGSASSLTWSTAGDGTFDDETLSSAIYTPGTNDIANGTVDLTLTTDDPDGTGSCVAATSSLTITIEPLVSVDAGNDLTSMNTDPVNLTATATGNPTSIVWNSPSNGMFSDPNSLSTSYTPTSADLSSGSVTLQITVSNNAACPDGVDTVVINFSLEINASDISTNASVGLPSMVNILNAISGNTQGLITTVTSNPTKGNAVVMADQNIEYTSANNVSGTDSFTYEVCNDQGFCDSATANITLINNPPVIPPTEEEVEAGGTATIDVAGLITDEEDNIDLSTLEVVVQPISGAVALFDSNGVLTVDYEGLTFTGLDRLAIRVCDFSGECIEQEIIIIVGEVTGVNIINAVSPNGDGIQDFMKIINVEFFPVNDIKIYNRMGNLIYSTNNYDNLQNNFKGVANNGNEIPNGTYYYVFNYSQSGGDSRSESGFLLLQR